MNSCGSARIISCSRKGVTISWKPNYRSIQMVCVDPFSITTHSMQNFHMHQIFSFGFTQMLDRLMFDLCMNFFQLFLVILRRLIVLVNLVVAMWAVCHVVECRRIVDNYCTYCLASLNKRFYGVATLISLRLKVVQQRRVRTKPSWFLSTRTKERQNTTVISFRTILGLFGHRGA